jgi:Xaa-Pro aminopeptidase
MTTSRIRQLRQRLRVDGLNAFLVTVPENVRYLTGFTGSNGLAILTQTSAAFLTDSRYVLQSAKEVRGFRRLITARGLLEEAAQKRLLKGSRTVGFESHAVTYAQYRRLRVLFPGVSFRPTADLVEEIALVKDRQEIALLTRAAAIADAVFGDLLPSITAGMTELDVAAEISWLNRKHGAERDAFDTIVASGPRGALPHARPTSRKIRNGEFVTIDFGSTLQGYNSDLTRTVALGRVPPRLRTAYRAVQEAQQAAVQAARAGMRASDLDAVARRCIASYKLGKYFVHSLGHGLGLRIHERPRVSELSREVLRSGSVITIEPGVYIPGVGGVRIEDDVVLRDDGCRLLTSSPRELLTM